ncbi:MAG: penicillin-binding protein 2, partial [Gammaproteobacteria bacterium]
MVTAVPLKDHQSEKRLFLSRLIIAAFVILVLTALLVGRLVQLQIVDYQRFSELSQGNRLRIEPLPPTRGLVFDRNGVLLAENIPTWQLVMIPEEVINIDDTLARLKTLGLLDSGEHQEVVDFVGLRRDFERVRLRNLTEEDASRFAVRRHQFPGVDIQEGLIRH